MKKYNDSVKIPQFTKKMRRQKKLKRTLILGALALVAVGAYGAAKYHDKNKNILVVDDADAWDILFWSRLT